MRLEDTIISTTREFEMADPNEPIAVLVDAMPIDDPVVFVPEEEFIEEKRAELAAANIMTSVCLASSSKALVVRRRNISKDQFFPLRAEVSATSFLIVLARFFKPRSIS